MVAKNYFVLDLFDFQTNLAFSSKLDTINKIAKPENKQTNKQTS